MIDYIRDGTEIYIKSFATIRAEADLSSLPPDLESVAVRLIHSCGMTDIVTDLAASPGAATCGRQALVAGAPILCDARIATAEFGEFSPKASQRYPETYTLAKSANF